MPKRTDIESILIIGAGPIVIGQACEFDYSGTQACRALKEEGYRIILVNSNPATIMTDPALADATYIEPVEAGILARVIERERPDALLPTMGGQTALNCALNLARDGVLAAYDVELIGASREAIDKAEDRELFNKAMAEIGLETPQSGIAHSLKEAWQVQARFGFPCVIRPSFTLGGSGGGIPYNNEEFEAICARGLELSPTSELLIDESLIGWKEFEMEVVRDCKDNCIIVCGIENLDPMGVHTGDSITVAPIQTLTDKEYQRMRDASIAVLRKIGVETGGSNVQFAVNPQDGRMVVVEMNPRVSRSSALASKATGFPIAKVAAKLAIGYTLDELSNDITRTTPASFEPTIDYIVTKIPRFTFEKFPQAEARLTTQMHAVGEVMGIGRTFSESLQKALRSLEVGSSGFNLPLKLSSTDEVRTGRSPEQQDAEVHQRLIRELRNPGPERIWYLAEAFRRGFTLEEIAEYSHIDPWFLVYIEDLIAEEQALTKTHLKALDEAEFRRLKRMGFSDKRLGECLGCDEKAVRTARWALGVHPVYKRIDTCAAEFATETAYLYSTYETYCESRPSSREKVLVLGGGPNRIGQGIEFDYCCVHAVEAMREEGYESIMVNCNPETVSTDYDVSDRLYFEPVTLEDVLEIIHLERPYGVIVQYGGQTPLQLAAGLAEDPLCRIIGTAPEVIDLAENREKFQAFITKLGLKQPPSRTVMSTEEALSAAHTLDYPIMIRPSYVLGGRAMEIVHTDADLVNYMQAAVQAANNTPILLDQFLDHSIEVDVDVICDGEQVTIGGIMQHIEQAGVHSGDSACSLPPYTLSAALQDRIREQAQTMALALGVVGLMNTQFAVRDDTLYILEVNPRASRTVPFVSKCIGVSLAKIAAKTMIGISLKEQGFTDEVVPKFIAVKESVFPFAKFQNVDPQLGPEMKSTGEVMGIGESFAEAFKRATLAAGERLPTGGTAFISVRDDDKPGVADIAKQLMTLGFKIIATGGTLTALTAEGVACEHINKVKEGRPDIADALKNKQVDFIVNTTEGRQAILDSAIIRRLALQHRVPCTTTLSGGSAFCQAMLLSGADRVRKLQALHAGESG